MNCVHFKMMVRIENSCTLYSYYWTHSQEGHAMSIKVMVSTPRIRNSSSLWCPTSDSKGHFPVPLCYFNYLPTCLFYACLVYWLIFSLCPGWSSLWTLLSVTFSLPPMLQEWGRGNATSVLPIPPSPNTPASKTHPLDSNLGKGFQIWIGVHSTDAVVSCYDKRLDSR